MLVVGVLMYSVKKAYFSMWRVDVDVLGSSHCHFTVVVLMVSWSSTSDHKKK